MNNEILKYFPALDGDELIFIQNITAHLNKEQASDFANIYNARRRDPQTVLITTFGFVVGICGINRFYLGQTGLGFLYLFTAGFCGIGTLVDLFRYKSLAMERNMQIANEVLLQLQFSQNSSNASVSAPVQSPVPIQPPVQMPISRTATLFGITGFYAGQQIPVPSDGIIMGRDGSLCNLPVQSSSVSRQHARLYYGAGQDELILEDLGSTNGTFILNNSSWTRISSPITLTIFRRFRLGDSGNEFEIR